MAVIAASDCAAASGTRPSDDLARNVRTLAKTPSNVALLIETGKAALRVGDAQAAGGFFGRARELAPRNPAAQAGMASALVALNQPAAALEAFAQAERLGAPPASTEADLGLAYDLLGEGAKAQSIYRDALSRSDNAETRVRLALSLAIGGDGNGGLQTLRPLLASNDPAALRARAFILALGGDVRGSIRDLEQIAHGSAAAEPFLRRVAALSRSEKAAAFNLGIFPNSFQALDGPLMTQGDPESDAVGRMVKPMVYGGVVGSEAPTTAGDAGRNRLAAYGVFAVP